MHTILPANRIHRPSSVRVAPTRYSIGRKDGDQRRGQPVPGDGVLQVTIGQLEPGDATLWPSTRYAGFGLRIDEEWNEPRCLLAKGGHGQSVEIAPVPYVVRHVVFRRERAWLFRTAHETNDFHFACDLAGITFSGISEF